MSGKTLPLNYNCYIALLHYPMVNKKGEKVVASVTPMDIHDLSRLAKTYDLGGFFVVTPETGQLDFLQRVIKFWCSDRGTRYNQTRAVALKIVNMIPNIEEGIEFIKEKWHMPVKVVTTSAVMSNYNIEYAQLGKLIKKRKEIFIITFGTGYGIHSEFRDTSDYRLPPIKIISSYNHLSVRTAAGIIIDRLLGREI